MPAPQGNIKVVVYALSDPRNPKLPFYVGKTSCPLKQRLSGHRCWSKKFTDHPLSKWILGLAQDGIIPTIYELESCPTAPIAKEREVCWINFFRPLGTLTNKSDGDGSLGMKKGPPCLANRMATIARNKKGWSEETRARRSLLLKGRKFTAAQREAFDKSPYRKVTAELFSAANEAKKIKVQCVETGVIFDSLKAAAKFVNGCSLSIKSSINKNRKFKGFTFKKYEHNFVPTVL